MLSVLNTEIYSGGSCKRDRHTNMKTISNFSVEKKTITTKKKKKTKKTKKTKQNKKKKKKQKQKKKKKKTTTTKKNNNTFLSGARCNMNVSCFSFPTFRCFYIYLFYRGWLTYSAITAQYISHYRDKTWFFMH